MTRTHASRPHPASPQLRPRCSRGSNHANACSRHARASRRTGIHPRRGRRHHLAPTRWMNYTRVVFTIPHAFGVCNCFGSNGSSARLGALSGWQLAARARTAAAQVRLGDRHKGHMPISGVVAAGLEVGATTLFVGLTSTPSSASTSWCKSVVVVGAGDGHPAW